MTATAPAPQIVQVYLMDTYVPSIPEIKPDDVKLRFPYQQLTKIKGKTDYKQICVVGEEIYCNTLSIKSSFSRGKRGHKGSVTRQTIYRIDTGNYWFVPAKGGVYPIFRANTTKNAKKQTITDFISRKTNIKMSEVVKEQLKNQLIDSLAEAFILELCEFSRQYNGSTMFDILEHVFTNYAKIDDTLILKKQKIVQGGARFLTTARPLFQKTGTLPEVGSRRQSPKQ